MGGGGREEGGGGDTGDEADLAWLERFLSLLHSF